ncbi:MAG TPA: tetratricopeptide repeat protein [Phycisphaerae bacterium]|nr:tetratricopeptide repeat protein [Phycisphaerae bacterium]
MTTVTIQQAFELALKHHQAGRLVDAEAIYKQIIAQQPNHADAIHLLGVIAHQAGKNQHAAELINRAIALNSAISIYHNNLGIVLENQRKFDEAIAEYRIAIKLNQDYAEAYNNLGNALSKKGLRDEAIAAYKEAIRIKPDYAEPYNNMGNVLKDQKKLTEAIDAYRTAIKLQTKYAEAYNNLGNALYESGQHEEALKAIRAAIERKPDLAEAYNNLVNVLRSQNRMEEAIRELNSAIKRTPNLAPLYSILGAVLMSQERLDESIQMLFTAIKIKPDYPEAYMNLALALREKGRLNESVAAFQAALRYKPEFAEAHNSLGMLLQSQGFAEQAIVEFEAALKAKPDLIDAYNNLGNAHKSLGRLDMANEVYGKLLKTWPEFAIGHNNIGTSLLIQGRIDECVAAYRESIRLQPDLAPAHSNLVYAMHFLTDCSQKEMYEEHLRWNTHHGEPRKRFIQDHKNDRNPDRRIKIGYVSPDLRGHSVAFFMENLLAHHDPGQFEIFCYADLANPDDVSARLKTLSHHWRDTTKLNEERFADLVRKDGIDILVDLAGHTAGNRLTLFARKPAPVQVTWLGYPDTTGMTAMDYRFTDAHADPKRTAQKFYTEKLIWLENSFLCYRPLDGAPPVGPSPFENNQGRITFGCFNILSKINVPLAKLWSQILQKVPDSRLIMKSYQGLQDAGGKTHLMQKFTEAGIDAERVTLLGLAPTRAEHLKQFNLIDIAMDSYPYNGTTTTCDGLWMGVPVITLSGKSHMSRVGVSLLTNVGLSELIAKTPEEYVDIAVKLAEDKPRLNQYRKSIRELMSKSQLMNAREFAGNIEKAYRDIWRKWASQSPATILEPEPNTV